MTSRLERLVRAGTFVVTAEVVPPRGADGAVVRAQARELIGYADAANVTDNPRALVHMSPVAGAAFVAAAGLEPTMQITCRDRNRLGLAADLFGGWALGARNLFCLTGDPLGAGDEPDAIAVHDLAVEDLVRLASELRTRGRLPSGVAIADPPAYFVGVADVPLAPAYDPARLERKLDAGAGFVMTQIVYDLDALADWLDLVRSRGITERAAVIVGVAPLRSAAQARFLNERVPGVLVPPALVAELEEAGDLAPQVGVARCVELVRRLREAPGVAGVHVMGMGHEEGVRAVIEGAGLLPRPPAPGPSRADG
ncbi:MAG: methylenetetrahydrofolate reductase [Actinomycetota bacterium]|nr:MAG: methylenetetrahydrofolate reductase [Actinomycetota bacterium]